MVLFISLDPSSFANCMFMAFFSLQQKLKLHRIALILPVSFCSSRLNSPFSKIFLDMSWFPRCTSSCSFSFGNDSLRSFCDMAHRTTQICRNGLNFICIITKHDSCTHSTYEHKTQSPSLEHDGHLSPFFLILYLHD